MSKVLISAGIDIGGTKIAVGVCDAAGSILAQRQFPTEAAAGFDRAIERMAAAIRECLAESGRNVADLAGIGIGCAGPVDPRRGTIDNPYTLPTWDGVDIVTPLGERFGGIAVRLENDADAALVGEAACGAGRGCERLVMLTFGTGVGSGVLLGGQVYRGARDVHPELGHLPITADGPDCYCGLRGCFESLASGSAIADAATKAGFRDAAHVFQATDAGDPKARGIVDRALDAVFRGVWTVQHTFVPERIILGGGVIDHQFARFAEAAERGVSQAVLNPQGATQVVQAELGNRAGLIGAAQLGLPHRD